MEKEGPPLPISISNGFSGKFLIKRVKMVLLLINPKSDMQAEGSALSHC
jgi:hypothetical protein